MLDLPALINLYTYWAACEHVTRLDIESTFWFFKVIIETPFTNGVFTYGTNTEFWMATAFYRLIPSQVYSDSGMRWLDLIIISFTTSQIYYFTLSIWGSCRVLISICFLQTYQSSIIW